MLQMLVAAPLTSGQGIGHGSTSSLGQCGAEYNKRYTKLHEGLETSVSIEGRSRVEHILNEVQILSDVEKLLLYLKLPTGVPKDEYLRSTPPSCLPVSNRREQGEAMTWIRSHLEEHGDVCMPKAEVYEEYKQYCVQHELRPLCNADFGKVMKTVFPDINTRRLGQRGQSKYFYGGLRKKLEHAPPNLPELEIQSKGTEADSEHADTEVFKASCQLVCEWADKLLDNKFLGIQSIAEHLVSSMYVNTKSVAAFTLIAAMQEMGNQNLKGSALFSTQTYSTMDKHKETNLLLQQKLHKNKVLQKQKEKLQAMKEENSQKQGSSINTSPDQRSTGTSHQNKSNTPSKTVKTAKLASPRASPGVARALQKDSSFIRTTSNEQIGMDSKSDQRECNLDSLQISLSHYKLSSSEHIVSDGQDSGVNLIFSGQSVVNRATAVDSEDIIMGEVSDRIDKSKSKSTGGCTLSTNSIQNESANSFNVNEPIVKSSRETPYTEMESGSCAMNHVRKISFEDISDRSLEVNVKDNKPEENIVKSTEDNKSAKVEMLSKSAGHLSLKMLLERKDSGMSCLNKSAGLLEKSKTSLLVSQSNVPGRSAFVPFAQVQQPRRDSSDVTQQPSSIIPINIPSSSEKSSLPHDDPDKNKHQATGEVLKLNSAFGIVEQQQPAGHKITDSVLKLFPSSAVQLKASLDGRALVAQPSLDLSRSDSIAVGSMRDSLTILTASTSLATSSTAETIVSASQHSPGMSKQFRTRFTPIRPKGSPSKATKDKVDAPVYDKRPVSEILKEKRAKEQAEAVAKLHPGKNLPTIPFHPTLSLGNGNFGSLQQLQSVTGKDVVIIVNNQPGQNLQNLVNQTSLFKQPVVQTNTGEKAQGDLKLNQFDSPTTSDQALSNTGQEQEGHSSTGLESGNLVVNDSRNNGIEVVSLIEEDEPQPASASSEMDVEADEGNISNKSPLDRTNEAPSSIDQENRDKFEQIYTETPAKIARLNITSPFRPDSACSIGRETPLRISKHQEPCSSRPESACSFGRETPSGARKRKSSDYQQRKDFKRLNSTGDEGDDVMIEKGLTELFSPSSENHHDLHRRTQSCTFELDKDIRRNIPHQSKSQVVILPEGLQSPDISSLEEEALIESYPNSLYAMRPNKSQRHSVGVSARSVKASQQRLLKQKQILDKQVGSFLQQNQDTCEIPEDQESGKAGNKTHSEFKIPQQQEVVKDGNGSSVHVGSGPSQIDGQGIRFENEPSGLPSEVADWINETIEKRQILNQSVLSEPELGVLNPQRASTAIDFAVPNFNFEVDHKIRARSSLSSGQSERNHQRNTSSKASDDNNFTVPKPPLTLKVKEGPVKSDSQVSSQRCQSLPMFTSMTKSPVSPLCAPSNKHPLYQRGVSMSPRQQPSEGQSGQPNLLSPVSGLTSPLRRIEVRDNHPISVSVHSSSSNLALLTKLREEGSFLNGGKQNHSLSDENRNQMRSYLASIQHSLQKPKDNISKEIETTTSKSRDKGFVMPPAKLILGPKSQLSPNLLSSPHANQDNTFNMSQFSDSGYHSSGPSPICNTVPASLGLQVDTHQNRISASVLDSPSSSGGFDVKQFSLVTQSTFPQTGVSVSEEIVKPSQTVINSSKHSAFIPIQSSNQNVQFIAPTPIRPTVSLPSQVLQLAKTVPTFSSQSHFSVERSQLEASQDIAMVSPKGHDPPPYEAAVKSLRQSNQHSSQLDNTNILTNLQGKGVSPCRESTVAETYGKERVSLLANMGKDSDAMNKESFGPFASKLVQLSKQTKSSFNQNPDEVSAVSPGFNSIPPGVDTEDKTVLLLTPCTTNAAFTPTNLHLVPELQQTSQNTFENERVDSGASSDKQMYEPMNEVIDKHSSFVANKISVNYQSLVLNSDGLDSHRQTGAKVLMSPNNDQNLNSFNMEIDFLQSPDSQTFIQSSSTSQSHENMLYSANPSHQSASNAAYSAYKNISDPQISSIIHTHNATGADVITSTNIQNQFGNMLHHQNADHNSQAHVKDVNMRDELQRGTDPEQLMSYSERDNQIAVLDTRPDFPVELDLMLQDLKDLERDLLQGHEDLNLD